MNPASVRDRLVLSRIRRFRSLNNAHLEVVMFPDSDATPDSKSVMTRRSLRKLERQGLIASEMHWVGGPGGGANRRVYHLTAAGQRVVATWDPRAGRRPPPPPTARFVDHALMAADTYIAFLEHARAQPGHDITDWEPDWDAAERLGSKVVVPDGFFAYRTSAWEVELCVEIDLATERPVRFAEKIASYLAVLRSGTWRQHLAAWPIVVTVTPDAARANALRAVTDAVLRAQRDSQRIIAATQFDFASLEELRASPGPLGPIWRRAGTAERQPLIPAETSRDDRPGPPDAA